MINVVIDDSERLSISSRFVSIDRLLVSSDALASVEIYAEIESRLLRKGLRRKKEKRQFNLLRIAKMLHAMNVAD